jgi:hypothetical protein
MNTDDKPVYKDQVSPDSLMGDFKGSGVMTILLVTLVVHALIILGTSFGYLKTEFLGDSKELSKEERVDVAVQEATVAIRDIAKKYDLSPQEISDRFAASGSRTDKAMDEVATDVDPAEPVTAPSTSIPETPEPDKPLSEIEKTLQDAQQGPALPKMEAEDDDLF